MLNWRVLRLWLAGWLIVLLAGAFSPAIGAAEPGVLEIWDVYYSPNRNPVVEAAIEQFKERYPGWEVRRTSRPLEDMRTAVMAALAAGAGPDIMLVNNGENMMGPMVRAGHLVGLDVYAEKYGWTERLFSPSLWNRARYSEDGTQFGEGVIWGVGVDAEIVGVYYNMDILNALGLAIPESLAELQEVMEAVKQAGYAPVALGLLDDWQFFHLYGAVQHATLAHQMGADAAQEYLDDIVIRGSRDRTWLEPGNVEAARIVQEWAQKGYFVDGYTALGGDDALAVFEAGVAAIFIQGSWYSSSIAGVDFDVAFRPFPPVERGGELPPQIGGMATPLGINARSAHPDVAAEFLDILINSDTTVSLQLGMDVVPARVPAPVELVPEGTVYHDILVAWNEANQVNRVGHFLDWTTPTMWDTMAEAGRELVLGSITPEEFVQKIEDDYRSHAGQ